MEYAKGVEFLKEYAQRTLANLIVVEEKSLDGAYEVTQLVNSLLAMIVFPKERALPLAGNSNCLNSLQTRVVYPESGLNDRQLLRNLRNAISHSHIFFEKGNCKDTNGNIQIESVIFVSCHYVNGMEPCPRGADCDRCRLKSSSAGTPDFQLTIPVNELRQCVADLVNEISAAVDQTNGQKV